MLILQKRFRWWQVNRWGDEYRSAPLSIVVPADQTITPTIEPVQAGDTSVGGTAEPGSTVTVEIPGEDPVTKPKRMRKAIGRSPYQSFQKATRSQWLLKLKARPK